MSDRDRGYQQTEKKLWRDEVWWHIARNVPKFHRRTAVVFLIESADGLEIEKALKLGFREMNLHVCNYNPAIVASIKRRYPCINTYGVDAKTALLRASRANKLAVISLDFCGTITPQIYETLEIAARCSDKPLIIVNIQRGRENWHRSVRDDQGIRQTIIEGALSIDRSTSELRAYEAIASGIYISRRVPMQWFVMRLWPQKQKTDIELNVFLDLLKTPRGALSLKDAEEVLAHALNESYDHGDFTAKELQEMNDE